jgi:hypothetical protein
MILHKFFAYCGDLYTFLEKVAAGAAIYDGLSSFFVRSFILSNAIL